MTATVELFDAQASTNAADVAIEHLVTPPEMTPQTMPHIAPQNVRAQVEEACARVPPLWPLKNFVAVNPFVGLADKTFLETCSLIRRVTHGEMLMPLDYYRQQFEAGHISDADLQSAIDQSANESFSVASLQSALSSTRSEVDNAILTVADALDKAKGTQWTAFIVDEISKWCSAFYDEGQASWRMPWRGEPLFSAWKQAALRDANPEMMGLKGFRAFVELLPNDALGAIEYSLRALQVPAANTVDFLHRQMMSIAGWSGYVQYLVREKGLYGESDEALQHLLAIRLAYETALFRDCDEPNFRSSWTQNLARANTEAPTEVLANYLWQLAAENAYQRALLAKIAGASNSPAATASRPDVQAVFCIDVRSEVFRRALEAASPTVETVGFAGFFGFPLEFVRFGQEHGATQCPVLLTPAFRIRESVPGSTQQMNVALQSQLFSRRLAHSWNSFKTSAVSCFSFVETGGLLSGTKLIKHSLGLHHDEKNSMALCVDSKSDDIKADDIKADNHAAHTHSHSDESGLGAEQKIAVAAGALKNMGLTENLARVVMICGHGSSTTNNPYGSGLDCGACGGHSGEANARVAALVLNQKAVREGLKSQGIVVPDDTHFLAALHNTTTDDVALFDEYSIPATHAQDVKNLQSWLQAASRQTRAQRAPLLGLSEMSGDDVDKKVRALNTDWAQTRPEWGLVGNAAFIAAPRLRTKSLNLGGRTFLNNYDYQSDADGAKLELIMTAPMVVASWINLQYFASTVNNRHFGSGNKTIHNVVGTVGIWQGNSGDLQVGLPLQSVHNGEKWMHEPLRLSVLIEAPRAMMNKVIESHQNVRELLDNGWLHLIAIEEEGQSFARYCGGGQWQ